MPQATEQSAFLSRSKSRTARYASARESRFASRIGAVLCLAMTPVACIVLDPIAAGMSAFFGLIFIAWAARESSEMDAIMADHDRDCASL